MKGMGRALVHTTTPKTTKKNETSKQPVKLESRLFTPGLPDFKRTTELQLHPSNTEQGPFIASGSQNVSIESTALDNPGVSAGLQPLFFTRHMFLRLTDHFDNILETGLRSYEIFNTFGSRIYLASVFAPRRSRRSQCDCMDGNFEIFVWDHQGTPALRIGGSTGQCGQGAGLIVSLTDGLRLGMVNQVDSCCYVNYNVIDCDEPPTYMMKIKGPMKEYGCFGGIGNAEDFGMFSVDQKLVGRVSRDWDLLGINFAQTSLHDHYDSCLKTYGASVPIEFSPHIKAVLLSFLLLLDLQFYAGVHERQNLGQSRNYGFLVAYIVMSMFAITIFMAFYLATRHKILRLD